MPDFSEVVIGFGLCMFSTNVRLLRSRRVAQMFPLCCVPDKMDKKSRILGSTKIRDDSCVFYPKNLPYKSNLIPCAKGTVGL